MNNASKLFKRTTYQQKSKVPRNSNRSVSHVYFCVKKSIKDDKNNNSNMNGARRISRITSLPVTALGFVVEVIDDVQDEV